MTNSKPVKKQQFSEEDIEQYLHKKLYPIKPRPEFVTKVQRRIERNPVIILEPNPDFNLYYILILGVITGLVAILITRLIRKA